MKQPNWITNGTKVPFYVRKSFSLQGPVRKASIRVTGLGQFNLFLNGKKVSDHILDPGWTDYRKAVQYLEFDLTEQLQAGENAIGMEVGNGWFIMDDTYGYTFHFPPIMPPNPNPYRPFGEALVAWAALTIQYADGHVETIVTDPSWKTAPHPVIHSNVYGTEIIDGSLRREDFSCASFDDTAWEPARIAKAPEGEMILPEQPPIREICAYPARFLGAVEDRRIYDLGQNMAGILTVHVKGKAGNSIRFYPAEKLDESGLPDQMAKNWMMIDSYVEYRIAKDDVWEDVSQTFTYFAGRYFAVEGEAEVRNLVGHAITSAWKQSGTFHCDDDRYNRIYTMIEKTVEANMVSVHTDCPTIERFAWQEPNHLMGAAILFMKDGRDLWRKFLADMRRAQHTAADRFVDYAGQSFCPGDGLVPSQAPCYIPNVLPVPGMGSFYDIIPWGSSIILAARWHYLFYGDLSIIEENYDAGLRYLEHLKTKINEDGFINHGLGDWGNPEGELARENIETVFLYADAKTLAWFAELLGKKEDQASLQEFAESVRRNYNARLLVPDASGHYCYRSYEHRDQGIVITQACEALPLYWGMVPDDKIVDVQAALQRALDEKGSLMAGEVGLPYVIQAAARAGLNDRIARFITKSEHPSYYAFVLDGETTLGEYWENNPRSHCHDMMGHIIEWYYNTIAGIEIVEPGFKKIRIHPWMPDTVHSFTCTYRSPYGTIVVKGSEKNGRPEYTWEVPEAIEVVE